MAGNASFEQQKAEDQGHPYSFSRNSINGCLIKQDSEMVIIIFMLIILLWKFIIIITTYSTDIIIIIWRNIVTFYRELTMYQVLFRVLDVQ